MRKFQTSGSPERRGPRVTIIVMAVSGLLGCGVDVIPPELKPMIDSRMPRAISLAESVATKCAAQREAEGSVPAASPAAGTSLAEELEVVEILVRCDWGDSDEHSPEAGAHSFMFPPLRQATRHTHAPSPVLVYDTFVKRGDHDFERVLVPSQFSDATGSADIVATRPIPGGGTVEVTVATVKR